MGNTAVDRPDGALEGAAPSDDEGGIGEHMAVLWRMVMAWRRSDPATSVRAATTGSSRITPSARATAKTRALIAVAGSGRNLQAAHRDTSGGMILEI